MSTMRRLIWVGVLLVWAGASHAQSVLTVDEAAKRIGETITFEGRVAGVASSPQFKATYLSFGRAYPMQTMSVLFSGEHEELLAKFPRFNGLTVRVTGTVEKGSKCPEIRVTDASQIQIVQPTDMVALDADGDGGEFRRQMATALLTRFKAGDYATLDQLADQWRRERAQFRGGVWKIAAFYRSFGPGSVVGMEEFLVRLEEWKAACPDSITPRLIHASWMTSHAWDARGGGWASTVTEEGWKLFRERLALARDELAELAPRRNECPMWYAIMQTVALGQGWPRDQYEKLYEAAVRREPEYITFHLQKVEFLKPKWHGREGEWVEFANSLLDRFPGGVGEELYARLAWGVREDVDRDLRDKRQHFFPDAGFTWEPMKAGFERILARWPDANLVRNVYAVFAGKADDRETVQRLLLELGDQCDMGIWLTWENVALARTWAANRGPTNTYINLFR
jgi:hypothetical protein